MNEIKFRAWDNKRDIYHYNIQDYGWLQPVFDDGEELEFYDFLHDKERFVVEQYTGYHDKNGKEIFDGDICNFFYCGDALTGKVFQTSTGQWLVSAGTIGETTDLYYDQDSKKIEIVGNRHEKPELKDEGTATECQHKKDLYKK